MYNTDNTEQGVGMLPWWFFLSGVRTWPVQHYSVDIWNAAVIVAGRVNINVGLCRNALVIQSARESKTTWRQHMWREMIDLVLVASQH